MARIIMKSPYLKPNRQPHLGNYVKYIATREGVEPAEKSKLHLTATEQQTKLIRNLLDMYPDCKELYEYQDYKKAPTRENADELLRRATEMHAELFADREKYAFVHRRMLYESAGHHNAVFVGYDADGIPRHAHKRSTAKEGTYKGNVAGSLPEYSFHWTGTGNQLYLFEAPIDLLSWITLYPEDWRKNNYAASCSVSDRVLFQMLQDDPKIQTVHLCFDNDEAGQTAAKRISDKLFIRGVKSEILVPNRKDWNEDLLHGKEETACKASAF